MIGSMRLAQGPIVSSGTGEAVPTIGRRHSGFPNRVGDLLGLDEEKHG